MLDEETLDYHRLIKFEYMDRMKKVPRKTTAVWRISVETLKLFHEKMTRKVTEETEIVNLQNYGKLFELVSACCDEAFPRRNVRWGRKKELHWWSEGVKEKRKIFIKNRRRMTRENRNGTDENKLRLPGNIRQESDSTTGRFYNQREIRGLTC